MTQPAAPAGQPSTAPAPTSTPPAPPAPSSAPPAGTQPAPQQSQPVWSQPQPAQPQYQQPPVQYVPVMPLPPTVAAPPAGSGDSGTGDGEGQQDLSRLPQWVQKQITQLREENAKRRVSERTAVVNQHAWIAAQQLGVNGQALFGSLAWQKATEQLDPSKPDFGRHLAETIWQTVRDNPWMAAQPTAPQAPASGQPGAPDQQSPAGQQAGQPPAPGTPGQAQPPQPGAPGQPPAPQPYGVPPNYPGYPGYPAPAGYPAYLPPPGWPPRPTPPPSGAEFAAGNNAGAPITEAQLAQMSPAEIEKALAEGKLKHLL